MQKNSQNIINNVKELFDNYVITIPSIQRDYAQGRIDSKQNIKGKGFFNYILKGNNNKKPLTIDLIYAYKDGEQLYPIDGQQRLTSIWITLIFLYSKLDKKENNWPAYFTSFTYKTRNSSIRFIKKLVDTYLTGNSDNNNKIYDGKSITNENWFLNSWKQDPTIKGMINAFNYLSKYYNELLRNRINETVNDDFNASNTKKGTETINKIYKIDEYVQKDIDGILSIKLNLIEQNNNNINLTDTYIKMNDRGKPLTNFDNLKADIIEYSNSQNLKNKNLIESGINNNWNDLFIINLIGNEQCLFEEYFFTFLNLIFLIKEIKKENIEKNLKNYKLNNITEYKEEFEDIKKYIDDKLIDELDQFFKNINQIQNINNYFKNQIPDWAKKHSQISNFRFISKLEIDNDGKKKYDPFALYNIILFYSIYLYFVKFPNNITDIEWYRIVCNIVEDEDIATADKLKPIINNIDELFDTLINYKTNNLKGVYKSEFDKFDLVKKNKICIKSIEDAENKHFYKGYIDFLFKDYNISSYINNNNAQKDFDDRKKVINNKIFNDNGFINQQLLKDYFKYLTQIPNLSNADFLEHTQYCMKEMDPNVINQRKMFKNMLKDVKFIEYFENVINSKSPSKNANNTTSSSNFEGLYNNDEFYNYYLWFRTDDKLRWVLDGDKYIRLPNTSTNDRKICLDYNLNKKIINYNKFCNIDVKTILDNYDNSKNLIASDANNKKSSHPIIVLNHNDELTYDNDKTININDVIKPREVTIRGKDVEKNLKKLNIANIEMNIKSENNDEIKLTIDCIIDIQEFKKELEKELKKIIMTNKFSIIISN